MIKKYVIIVSAAVVLFLFRINNVQAEPSLLTWASFAVASDLSGLAGNLENGQPANIFGGVGSGLAWAGGNSFVMSPDRGPNAITWNTNVDNTTSYISRLQNVTLDLKQTSPGVFSLTPTLNSTTLLYSSTPLDYNYYNYGATSTVAGGNYYFNGRSDNFGDGASANTNNARFDPEAVRVSPDGRYVYLSDEYGPYVYQFDRETGLRTKTFDLASNLSVTNQSSQAAIEIAGNTIGRVANKGMEGLAISPDGSTLFGFMQGPLIQDGGNGAPYNRIVKINIINGEIAQYAYNNQVGGTNPSSEILAINNDEFLVLERDNKGLGENNAAVVKDLIKINLSGATDVTGLSGSDALVSNAVTGTVFLDIVAAMNAAGISSSNIPAKLESIAWGQDMVINGTNTHMLYMGNDNDFTASSSGPSVVYVFGVTDADLGGSTFVNQSISFQLGGDLYVGSNSTVDPLSYASGTNFYNNVYVGYDAEASNNRLLVANPGTVFSNSGTVYVGYSGSGNSLTISNGGAVIVSGITNNWLSIGEQDGANSNVITVTGSNSQLNVAGWLEVGWGSNSGNRMIICQGAMVSDSNGYIGYTNGSSENSALVTDPNSTWSNSGNFYVGYFGDSNSLVISNGGRVINQWGSVGFHGDGNTALVTGSGSLWSNAGSFSVGNCGSDSTLVVSNGGGVISSNGYIAEISRWSNCSAVITGSGSYWSNTATLTIGSAANAGNNPSSGNSLIISDGGRVTDSNAVIANATNFSGTSIMVTGSNSLWSNSDSLLFGVAGGGNSMIISSHGMVSSRTAIIGVSNTSTGNDILITGVGSSWSNIGTMTIGARGSGTITVANGGLLAASQIMIGQYGDLDFGRSQLNDSAGSVAGDIVFTATNDENFGINFNQTNSLNFSNNVSGPGWICALGTGTTVMSGSNSYSQYTKIDAGTIVTTTANALGTGYVSLAGGSNPASLLLSNNLTISSLSSGDGGTNNLVALAPGAGSSTLTINGSGSTNYGGVISGSLSLVRSGTGTTALTGSNSFSGPTLINGGTLAIDGTNESSPVTVAAGGTLAGKGMLGTVTVATGGTLSPSSASGTPSILSIDALALESGSSTILNVMDPSLPAGIGYDRISVTHGLTFGGSLYLNVPVGCGVFELNLFLFATESEVSGFQLYLSEGTSSVTMTENHNVWSSLDGSYTFTEASGVLQHAAVPEPSVTPLLIMAGASLVVLRFISKKQSNR